MENSNYECEIGRAMMCTSDTVASRNRTSLKMKGIAFIANRKKKMFGELSAEKLVEIENQFKTDKIMGEDEHFVNNVVGDMYVWTMQTRGHWYFTERKLIFGGWGENLVIPYDKMREVKKCCIGRGLIPFLPIGIMITFENEKGKTVKRRMSVMKRDIWIDEICKRARITPA